MAYDIPGIASRLRSARITAGYSSAKDFARHCGIPQSTYTLHETGRRALRGPALTRYCDELGISVEWLIEGGTQNSSASNEIVPAARGAAGGTRGNSVIPFPAVRHVPDVRAELIYLMVHLIPAIEGMPLSRAEQWSCQKIAERAGEFADAILTEVAKRERNHRR